MSEFVAEVNLGNFNKIHLKSASTEELLQSLADVAAVAPAIVEQVNVISSAGKAANAAVASIERPASKATAEPGSSPAPKCDCGVTMNDCLGKKTKAGALYKMRYYPACKNDDCKAQVPQS